MASDHGQNATLTGAFTGIPSFDSPANAVELSLSGPSAIRSGGVGTIYLNYTNHSPSDAPAPLVILSGPNSNFALPGETPIYAGQHVILLAINQHGPAGLIPAGDRDDSVQLFGTSTITSRSLWPTRTPSSTGHRFNRSFDPPACRPVPGTRSTPIFTASWAIPSVNCKLCWTTRLPI